MISNEFLVKLRSLEHRLGCDIDGKFLIVMIYADGSGSLEYGDREIFEFTNLQELEKYLNSENL